MRQHNKILALAMGLCIFEATPALAADSTSSDSSQANLAIAIEKVNAQTEELQKEVKALKAELRQVKQQKQAQAAKQKRAAAPAATPESTATTAVPQAVPAANERQTAPKNAPSYTFLTIPKLYASPVINASLPNFSPDLDPSAFLSYQTSMAQGLFFLQQRDAIKKALEPGEKLASADRPQILLGGKLEAQTTFQTPYSGSSNSSIDLVTAELEVLGFISPWATGVMYIDYQNNSLNQVLLGSGNPVNNSNIFLNRGYITIGNLRKSPFYFNMGQMYAPFGAYNSWMLTNPTTKVLGRSNVRAAELGFYKNGFNVSAYGFNGAANTDRSIIDNWGADTNYNFNLGQYSASLGVGFINDLSDSQGAQLTGGGDGSFQGFSTNSVTETIRHFVPGVDLNGFLGRGPWYAVAEGVLATRGYDPTDMTFNNAGAEPKTFHAETGLDFKTFGKKSVFSVAYDETWQGLALGLPKNSYTATYNISIWKNTVETLEYRHDVNYAATDTASGTCDFTDPTTGAVFTVCPGPAGGGSRNTILAQLGVYF